MKKFNYFLRSLLAIVVLAIGVNSALASEEVTFEVGTDIKAATDVPLLSGKITMTTAKNSSGTAPAYNNNHKDLRLYYASSGNGGSLTFTLDGIKITQLVITASSTSYTPTTEYSVDGGAATAGAWSGTLMTISDIEASETLTIQNANTSNKQLRIKSFTITYEEVVLTEPTLKADVDALEFTAAPGATTKPETVTLTTANLSGNVTCTVSNNDAFAVTDNGNNTYDVTFTAPAEVGTTNATLTFSAPQEDGVTPVVVSLTGESTYNVTDVLNTTVIGSGSVYADWSGKEGESDAVYAGNSYLGYTTAIQLRSNSNSGIVSTTSGGTLKSVTITVEKGSNTIDVYGSNTPYTSAANLYNASKGTKLGSLTATGTIDVTDEYKYVGIRSYDGAIYLAEVQIEWAPAAADYVAPPTFNPAAGAVTIGTPVTITSTTEGATIKYSTDGESYDNYTEPIVIDAETTLYAYAQVGENKSETVSAEYTIAQLAAPEFSVASGAVFAGTSVYITAAEGATIKYSTDGESYNNYTEPIDIDAETTLYAYATQTGYIDSEVVNATYTLKDGYGVVYDFTHPETLTPQIEIDKSGGTNISEYTFTNGHISLTTTDGGTDTRIWKGEELRMYNGATLTLSGALIKSVTITGSALAGGASFTEWTGEANEVTLTASDAIKIYTITVEYEYYDEVITSETNYYLIPDATWKAEESTYYAKFINKNTGAYTWVEGGNTDDETAIVFYLSQYNTRSGEMPTYTHVVFFKSTTEYASLSDTDVTNATCKTEEMVMDATNCVYTVGGSIGTGIENVEVADGIRYAYGVVEAEGAIEVYSVNGAVVARGNDIVDLRDLNRGIYIVRNGDQVRKVVR